MANAPIISVIMPVYNAGKFLHAAIESILNQTFTNFEFLIFNDASTDDSLSIINSYTDDRIKLVNSPVNTGYVKHLNDGLAIASGEYIARMDADDISGHTRFEEQLKYLQQNSDVQIVGSFITLFSDETGDIKTIKYPTKPGKIKWHAVKGTPLAHPAVMFKKECLQHINYYYDEKYYPAEDYDMWARLLATCNIANIAIPLLKYRTHVQQTSAIKFQLQQDNAMAIKKRYIASLFNIKSTKKVEEAYLFFNNPSMLTAKQLFSIAVYISGKAFATAGIEKKSMLSYIKQTVNTGMLRRFNKAN